LAAELLDAGSTSLLLELGCTGAELLETGPGATLLEDSDGEDSGPALELCGAAGGLAKFGMLPETRSPQRTFMDCSK